MKFIAATRGKDRGYSKHITVAGDKDAPLVRTDNWTTEEKKQMLGLLAKAEGAAKQNGSKTEGE
jgi:hypothetical protein